MAPMAVKRCLAAGIFIASAMAQESTPTPVSAAPGSATSATGLTTTAPASSITSAASASSSADVPLQLWSLANSLLTSYYPSTTITNVASLSWPESVVIGSSTYSVHATETSAPTSLSNDKPAATDAGGAPKEGPKNEKSSDRTLGIALGVVFGLLAVAIMALVLFCLHRRHRKHGGAGLFRRGPSVSDSEIGEWRAPQQPEMGSVATATGPLSSEHTQPSREWMERYNRYPSQHTPPAHLHPAFAQHHTAGVTPSSEENPFFSPMERSTLPLEHYQDSQESSNYQRVDEYRPGYSQSELDAPVAAYQSNTRRSGSSNRRSSSSLRQDRDSRPPTPFSPILMMRASSTPQQNPFASPEDDEVAAREAMAREEAEEEHDLVSPILPARSPQRRHSPMIHYPSWSEVSEFDFSGESEGTSGRGRSIRDRSSGSSSGDGYRRERDSIIGRSELA